MVNTNKYALTYWSTLLFVLVPCICLICIMKDTRIGFNRFYAEWRLIITA